MKIVMYIDKEKSSTIQKTEINHCEITLLCIIMLPPADPLRLKISLFSLLLTLLANIHLSSTSVTSTHH